MAVRSAVRTARAAAAAIVLCGCSGVQSALDPRGPDAAALAHITWVMIAGASAIFGAVIALLLYAVYRDPVRRARVSTRTLIVAGGIAFPTVVLSALLGYGVALTGKLRAGEHANALHVRITGHQYWWEVLYPGEREGEWIASANELRIPAGRPVVLWLTSADVIHSFWVPSLAGKIDLIPGRVTRFDLRSDSVGTLRGQCAEFCGADHARMALHVVTLAEADFASWLARERAPAAQSAAANAGADAFVAEGCGHCHAVRGLTRPVTPAPDLTHVASRAWIGAGTLENTSDGRIEWLARGERVKPGRAMPSYGHLEPARLRSIADYLGSLH